MIQAKELRLGNLIIWNPKLSNPAITLPAELIEVFSILQDRIIYVFPNIENRVEPFEDDVVQIGTQFKPLEELEPIPLTPEVIKKAGFVEKGEWSGVPYFEQDDLQVKQADNYFQRVVVRDAATKMFDLPIRHLHQLQNLYFALMGEELEVKLHGQQA